MERTPAAVRSGRSQESSIVEIAAFGGAGSAAMAAMVIRRIAARGGGVRFVGFLNDVERPGTMISGDPVLGPFAAWPSLPVATRFIAPLQKAKEMQTRAALVRGLGIPEQRWATVIDPDAVLAEDALYGHGTFIAPLATVLPAARIGAHVSIRNGAVVGHDVVIGDFCFVGVNAVVFGRARVGEGAHIAPGALIREERRVGCYSVVGVGAVVVRDVPDYAVVAGNPARVIGRIEPVVAR